MLREYRLTNFKAFGETVTIPIRPLTLIFGANSSGKSSIFQSLLLLKQTLDEAKNSETVLLPKGSLVDLGTYRDFVHRHDTERNFEFEVRFDLKVPLTYKVYKIQCPKAGLSVGFTYSREQRRPDVSAGNLAVISDADERQPIASYATESDEFGRIAMIDTWPEIDTRFGWEFWKSWWSVLEDCYTKKDSESLARLIYLNFFWERPEVLSDEQVRSLFTGRASEAAKKSIDEFGKEFEPGRDDFVDYMSDSDRKIDVSGYQNFLPCDFGRVSPSDLSRQPWQWINLPVGRILSSFRVSLENLLHLGPFRSPPKRFYEPSGDTTDYVGQSGEYTLAVLYEKPELEAPINKDLKRLSVGYRLKVRPQDEDQSLSGVFFPRLIDEAGIDASLRDVGFGISQVLPIVVQSRLSEKKTLLIEQPEIHLHPAHQAELGDLFIRSAKERGNTLLLETHSEHLLLRIMRRMRETSTGSLPEETLRLDPDDVAVLFVESDGSQSIVREMPLNERGELVKAWPGGFFEEGLREIF